MYNSHVLKYNFILKIHFKLFSGFHWDFFFESCIFRRIFLTSICRFSSYICNWFLAQLPCGQKTHSVWFQLYEFSRALGFGTVLGCTKFVKYSVNAWKSCVVFCSYWWQCFTYVSYINYYCCSNFLYPYSS